jgi:hypothetical protein
MLEMMISTLQKTPLPTILILAGIFFLILSVSGDIAGKIRVPQDRQKIAGIIGFILLLIGISLNIPAQNSNSPPPPEVKANTQNAENTIINSDKKPKMLSEAKQWTLIAEESFIDNQNGWVTGKYEDKNASAFREIDNGRYRWQTAFKKSWMIWDAPLFDPASNFFFAVDVKLVNGPRNDIGIGFLFRRTQDDYYFYKIADTQYFMLLLNHKGEWKTLIPWTFVKSIKPGFYNRIAVIAVGSALHLYINDIQVGYFEDSTIYNGNVILAIEGIDNSETIVDFDNIEFRRPE